MEQLSSKCLDYFFFSQSYVWLEVEAERVLQVVQGSRSIPALKKHRSHTVTPLGVRCSPHKKVLKVAKGMHIHTVRIYMHV